MCGIAGFCSSEVKIDPSRGEAVRRMTSRMRRRGPDAEGIWAGQGVTLGHRRLAILDLDPRSNQPMLSADGRYAIVFNGEIYNFRELRADLERQGDQFRTTSDTEVLLQLFARLGAAMLPKLRGMFALAIWDSVTRELFLARDPYGIKPLYYAPCAGGLLFASQVKAILASGCISATVEPAGLTGFYLWGSVPEPWTLYEGILALPAGHWMRVCQGIAQAPVGWNDIRENWRAPADGFSAAQVEAQVRESVRDSVQAHLVSDVPVSIFLSGGIDSGVIAGLAAELGAQVEGVTVAFGEFRALHEDEAPVAAQVAQHYGLRHHVRYVTREEFEQDIPLILDAMDQPSIDGVNTWFASKVAAERGYKVVLSGVGGDELFYGYSLMRTVPREAFWGRSVAALPGARALLGLPLDYLAGRRAHPKLKGMLRYAKSIEGAYFMRRGLFLPEELPALMDAEQAAEGLMRLSGSPAGMSEANAVNREGSVCLLDSTLYLRNQLLRDSDWASMAHSLELRTPLTDACLLHRFRRCHTMFRGGAGKRMLAHAPAKPLPAAVIERPKSGFGVPMTQWLSAATYRRDWGDLPLLAARRTPWTRRWGRIVVETFCNPQSVVVPTA